MRTTVTLDPDVERLLRDAMQKTGSSFKEVLNRAIREGLARGAGQQVVEPFQVAARPMGLRAGIDPAGFNRLLDELEVDDARAAGRSER